MKKQSVTIGEDVRTTNGFVTLIEISNNINTVGHELSIEYTNNSIECVISDTPINRTVTYETQDGVRKEC